VVRVPRLFRAVGEILLGLLLLYITASLWGTMGSFTLAPPGFRAVWEAVLLFQSLIAVLFVVDGALRLLGLRR